MEKQQISFGLRHIKTEQFATFEENLCDGENVQLTTDIKFAVNNETSMIGVLAKFQFKCNNQPFIKLVASCHFQIKADDWKLMLEKNQITIPKGLAQHLAVLTVGTSRGILHAKTEGTQLNRFFLPPLNLTEIVKSDQVFTFNGKDNATPKND